MAKFFEVLKGSKASEKEIAIMRDMDLMVAKANAERYSIDRDPVEIDHLAVSYPERCPHELNGATRGIEVKQIKKDGFFQALEVTFSKNGYSPAHSHVHYSVCEVVKGEIFDVVRDKRYDAGDWYFLRPHEVHSSLSVNGAVLRVYNTTDENVALSLMPTEQKAVKIDKLIIKELI